MSSWVFRGSRWVRVRAPIEERPTNTDDAIERAAAAARQALVALSATGKPGDQQEELLGIARAYCDAVGAHDDERLASVLGELRAIRQKTHEHLARLVEAVVSAATPAAPVVDSAAVHAAAAALGDVRDRPSERSAAALDGTHVRRPKRRRARVVDDVDDVDDEDDEEDEEDLARILAEVRKLARDYV